MDAHVNTLNPRAWQTYCQKNEGTRTSVPKLQSDRRDQ